MIQALFNQPFDEQLAYFRQKGYLFSPNSWRDVWKEAHSRAFTVARVTEMSVLQHVRESLDKAMDKGESFGKWKKSLDLENWTKQRFEIVYRTNISTSYHVGRYKQQQDLKHRRPWWQYRITPLMPSRRNRDVHKASDEKVFHSDHEFWQVNYPPNGFLCGCYTNTLSDRQLKSSGKKPESDDYKVKKEDRPDEGWDYNPGQAGLDAWKPDYKPFSEIYSTALRQSIRGSGAAGTLAMASIMPVLKAESEVLEDVTERFIEPEINKLLPDEDKLHIVSMDVEKVDTAWRGDSASYIGTNGQGEKKGQSVKTMKAFEGKEPIEIPEVDILSSGALGFTSGSHIFSVFRDMGGKKILLAMDSESKKYKGKI